MRKPRVCFRLIGYVGKACTLNRARAPVKPPQRYKLSTRGGEWLIEAGEHQSAASLAHSCVVKSSSRAVLIWLLIPLALSLSLSRSRSHACMHTHTHIHTHTYTCTYIHTCMDACIHTYAQTCTHIDKSLLFRSRRMFGGAWIQR